VNYLARRNGSVNWYYRESIPNDIRELVARATGRRPTEVWKTLGTSDTRAARAKVALVRADQHREWDDLRKTAAPHRTVPSSAEMADAVVRNVHVKFVDGQRAILRATLESGTDAVSEAARRKAKLVQAELYPSNDDEANMELVARVLCRDLHWGIAPGDGLQGERWNELVQMVTKAIQLGRRTLLDTLEGRPDAHDEEAVAQHIGGSKRRPTAKPGETLLELFDRYRAERLRDGKSADTLDAERKIVGHFAAFVGPNLSASAIGRPDIREFKRALSRVPHRWTTKAELKGMSIGEAADAWEKVGGRVRAQRTVYRELSAISTLFAWLIKNAYYDDANPVQAFFDRIDKAEAKYPPYTDVQLKAVFGSPLFVGCHGDKPHVGGSHRIRDWRYWLPLCALYTGARAGEIAQLLVTEVREEDGIWVFDFNEETDGSTTKSLKTRSSRRLVPVHPALMRLGLIEYVTRTRAAGHKQLFPEIKPGKRGDMSYMPSKFWQRYLKRIEVKEPGLCLHSFRHTFTDECRRQGVAKEVLRALLGHADSSITGHYGTLDDGTLQQRTAAITAISYAGLHS
jgi:integrase